MIPFSVRFVCLAALTRRAGRACAGQLLAIVAERRLVQPDRHDLWGDGVQTFALPQLGGRVPMHNGNGLVQGQMAGSENVTVTWNQMASHSRIHLDRSFRATYPAQQMRSWPTRGRQASNVLGYIPYDGSNPVVINANTISFTGGGQPHENMQPYLAVTFIIALEGLYPSQG